MNKKLLLAVIALSALLINSCKELGKEENINAVPEQFFTLKPVGTISGKVVDRHTLKPVKGAIVSIAFNGAVTKATSDESGSFSFANVPCNQDFTTGAITGTYQLTVSLVEVNKTIPDSLPKYREFYYNYGLQVTFIDLTDCDSCDNKVPVEGLEAHVWFDVAKLNTTINGTVVDDKYDPEANATVWLRDWGTGDVIQQTTTDANGNYTFNKVEDGTTVVLHAKSSDLTHEGFTSPITLVINRALENLRSQVTAERLVISQVDDVAPYVVEISPENLQDVSPNSLAITYRFSEPIKQTAYTVTNAPLGLGTLIDDILFNFVGLKKSASGNTNFTIAWDATNTILTITPAGIVGSAKYQVSIATALTKMTDRAGNAIAANASLIGDTEPLNFTTNGVSTIPSAPAVTRRLNTGIGFDKLNFGGGNVGLEWGSDANARSFNVYRSINGQPFTLLANNVLDTRYADNPGALVTGYAPPGDNDPFAAISVRYKVTGVSKDLVEGAESNIITVQDDVDPQFISANVDSSTADYDYVYLRFSEPLTMTTSQIVGNYSINNLPGSVASAISEAVYMGYQGGFYVVRLQITEHSITPGEIMTVSTSVQDLAGNGIDSNTTALNF